MIYRSCTSSNDDIGYFNSNNHFIETEIEKNNYNILGYVKVKDNKVLLKNQYDTNVNVIVINNHVLYYRLSNSYYQYYVEGTPTSDFNKNITGVYYPLSTMNSGNDIEITFEVENDTLKDVIFYMNRDNYNYTTDNSLVPEQYINYLDNINQLEYL